MVFADTSNQIGQQRIRVLIVDDNASVRSALEIALLTFDDLDVVGTASDGEEAARLCHQIDLDVVLMDILMPVMDGVTATRLIRQQCPQVQIVGLTSSLDPNLKQQALEAGALCCVHKSASTDEIADWIRAARAH